MTLLCWCWAGRLRKRSPRWADQIATPEWLLRHFPWNNCNSYHAAEHGQLHVLQWIKFRELPWDGNAYAGALRSGRLNAVHFLQQLGCPTDGSMDWLSCAVESNNGIC